MLSGDTEVLWNMSVSWNARSDIPRYAISLTGHFLRMSNAGRLGVNLAVWFSPARGRSWCSVYPACLQELEVCWQWGSASWTCAVVVLGASMAPLKKSISWHLRL